MGRIKRRLRKLYAVYIKRDRKQISYFKYIENGGELLRLDYPLNEDAIIIDAGGYIGDFVADMTQKFDCRVDVFEPVKRYAEKIRERFFFNDKVHVMQVGLGGSGKEALITVEGLGSSVFGDGKGEAIRERIKIISTVDYIKSKDYQTVDLIKINIEGGEYEFLTSLLEHPELTNRIKYFQIQFHDFVPDAQKMRNEIQKRLSKTHKLMWDFPFIWESWKLAEDQSGDHYGCE